MISAAKPEVCRLKLIRWERTKPEALAPCHVPAQVQVRLEQNINADEDSSEARKCGL